jgi:four helix bundle suffix protein
MFQRVFLISKDTSMDSDPLIPKHGGYRKLKSFQVSQLIYDVTARFCDRYIDKRSRTRDQMVQAARSGVQNIAEGSQASGTSKKTEIKLTSVARASLEELKLDYEDFLRQRKLTLWNRDDQRRQALIDRRCTTADEVATWVKEEHERGKSELCGRSGRGKQGGQSGRGGLSGQQRTTTTTQQMPASYPEIAANAALVLLAVACGLLDRQLTTLAKVFEAEGGFTERLYRVRSEKRSSRSSATMPTKFTRSTTSTGN